MPGPVVIDDGGSIRVMNKDGKMDELVVVDPKTHQSHDTAIGPFSKITVSYLNINGAVTSLTNDMPVDLKVGDEFHVNSGKLHIDGKIIAGQNCEITIRGEHQDPIVYGKYSDLQHSYVVVNAGTIEHVTVHTGLHSQYPRLDESARYTVVVLS